MYTREEFENLINNSPLFGIDKDNNHAYYETEKYHLFTLLTDYFRIYIFPHKSLDEYSFTLINTAVECIKYYDRAKGDFLHLFNKAMKRNLNIAKAKEIIDSHRHGIRLAAYDEQMIRKVVSFAKSKNLDIHDCTVQEKIALAFGIKAERVAELICINDSAVAVSATVTNDEGDEIELFDLKLDKADSAEQKIISSDSFNELIILIDTAFRIVQERQKKLLSLLLTAEVVKSLEYDIEKSVNLLNEREFFNVKIIDWYKAYGDVPTAKQIGEMCELSEQSLSRTYKNFKDKLKQKC